MELDKDLRARQEARTLAKQAFEAQKQLRRMPQEKLDAIVEAIAAAFSKEAEMLAQMAVGSYYYALNDCYEAIKWIGMAAEMGNAEVGVDIVLALGSGNGEEVAVAGAVDEDLCPQPLQARFRGNEDTLNPAIVRFRIHYALAIIEADTAL